ncbi:MAG: hypothetical protein WA990_10710 [Rubrobacteraceae bacterium]
MAEAEKTSVPEAWVGQEINVRYADADVPRWLDCTLDGAGAWGVVVSTGEKTSFFPWDSVIKIDLGHGQPAQGTSRGWGRR